MTPEEIEELLKKDFTPSKEYREKHSMEPPKEWLADKTWAEEPKEEKDV